MRTATMELTAFRHELSKKLYKLGVTQRKTLKTTQTTTKLASNVVEMYPGMLSTQERLLTTIAKSNTTILRTLEEMKATGCVTTASLTSTHAALKSTSEQLAKYCRTQHVEQPPSAPDGVAPAANSGPDVAVAAPEAKKSGPVADHRESGPVAATAYEGWTMEEIPNQVSPASNQT